MNRRPPLVAVVLFLCCAVSSPLQRSPAVRPGTSRRAAGDTDWADLLVRPGQAEAAAILREFQAQYAPAAPAPAAAPAPTPYATRRAALSRALALGGDEDEDDEPRNWWRALTHKIFDDAPAAPGSAALFDDAWRDVRAELGEARDDVADAARKTTETLAAWAARTRGPDAARLVMARGVAIAAYISETPFGGDPACVAAALLCEAHETVDGLSLPEIEDAVGPEAAALVRCLSNLSQLYRLQRARWDAEGDELWTRPADASDADADLLDAYRLRSQNASLKPPIGRR